MHTGNIVLSSPDPKVLRNLQATGYIKLWAAETVELHLAGQHDQCNHSESGCLTAAEKKAGQKDNKSPGITRQQVDKAIKDFKPSKRGFGKREAIGLYVAAVVIGHGVVFIAEKRSASRLAAQQAKARELQIQQQFLKNPNSFTKKPSGWSNIFGVGGRQPRSTRPFMKVLDVNEGAGDGFWVNTDGILVKRAYHIRATDGTTLKLYDMDGTTLSDGHAEEVLNSLASMHEMYPMKNPARIVMVNNEILNQRLDTADMVGAHGFTSLDGNPSIFLNASKVTRGFTAPKMGAMPSSTTVSETHYAVVHEYGHKYDAITGMKSAGGFGNLYGQEPIFNSLSPYGQSEDIEGYAEAFAEWHVTQGKTTNLAANAYAKNEGWFGAPSKLASLSSRVARTGERLVRTPEGARRYGVSIGQPIPELVEE